jgi:hypothetical protein
MSLDDLDASKISTLMEADVPRAVEALLLHVQSHEEMKAATSTPPSSTHHRQLVLFFLSELQSSNARRTFVTETVL